MFAPDSEGWSSRTRLKERFKTRIHHWGFDKNLLSLFEFRMLCIRHCLEDNLFCFGFKMVSFTSLLFPVSFGFFCKTESSLKRSWCDQVSSNFFHVSEGRKSIDLISWTNRIYDNMSIDISLDQILYSALNASMRLNPTDKNVAKILLVDGWSLWVKPRLMFFHKFVHFGGEHWELSLVRKDKFMSSFEFWNSFTKPTWVLFSDRDRIFHHFCKFNHISRWICNFRKILYRPAEGFLLSNSTFRYRQGIRC